jgi:hypothetical protein
VTVVAPERVEQIAAGISSDLSDCGLAAWTLPVDEPRVLFAAIERVAEVEGRRLLIAVEPDGALVVRAATGEPGVFPRRQTN